MGFIKRHYLVTIAIMAIVLSGCAIFGPRPKDPAPANLTVYFPDQAYFVSLSVQIHLLDVADFLKTHNNSKVEIQGHANTSEELYNHQKISQFLTQIISDHLLRLGVNPNQVKTQAFDYEELTQNPYVLVRVR